MSTVNYYNTENLDLVSDQIKYLEDHVRDLEWEGVTQGLDAAYSELKDLYSMRDNGIFYTPRF